VVCRFGSLLFAVNCRAIVIASAPQYSGHSAALAPPLRDLLRTATHETHERLHRHPGLGAVQAGTIDRRRYVALLGRLYGFHRSFEVVTGSTPQRSVWLESDLAALGVAADHRARLPFCPSLGVIAGAAEQLGAHYVVEGSALGGRGLARKLDTLLGAGVLDGRRFFSGHAEDTGGVWRACLERLAGFSKRPEARAAVVSGATATFAIFEHWLAGWDDALG